MPKRHVKSKNNKKSTMTPSEDALSALDVHNTVQSNLTDDGPQSRARQSSDSLPPLESNPRDNLDFLDNKIPNDDRHFDDERFVDNERFYSDEEIDNFITTRNLEAPEPRPGMKQRWVNTSGEHERIYMRRCRAGWKARDIRTIPKEWQAHTTKSKDDNQGYFKVAEMLLMEIPINRFNQIKAAIRKKTEAMNRVIKDDPAGRGGVSNIDPKYGGMKWDKYEVKESRSSRNVQVADD